MEKLSDAVKQKMDKNVATITGYAKEIVQKTTKCSILPHLEKYNKSWRRKYEFYRDEGMNPEDSALQTIQYYRNKFADLSIEQLSSNIEEYSWTYHKDIRESVHGIIAMRIFNVFIVDYNDAVGSLIMKAIPVESHSIEAL